MITFSELGRLGRLGNQFFQYSALRSLSLYHGYAMAIPNPKDRDWHGQNCLLNEFNIECQFLNAQNSSDITMLYREPNHMSFDPEFFNIKDNTNLYGFFQSTLYFKHCEEQIKKELTPKQHHLDNAKKAIQHIKEKYPNHEIVSIHLRRGDNTDGSNPSKELNEMYGKNNELDPNSFYGKYINAAFEQFENKKVKYLVFSGGARFAGNDNISDIEWCRQNLKGDNFVFSKGNTAINDFSLIMSCDHNIISHISSFGWWAAYLNQNQDKIVVAPEKYHPDMPEYTYREGFYPDNWRLV
jgi:thiol-disulfide isomerase/thioredoxin